MLHGEIIACKQPKQYSKLKQWLFSYKNKLNQSDLDADSLQHFYKNLILISNQFPAVIKKILEDKCNKDLTTMQKTCDQQTKRVSSLLLLYLKKEVKYLKAAVAQKSNDVDIRARFVTAFLADFPRDRDARILYEDIKDKNEQHKEKNMDGLTQFLAQKENELNVDITPAQLEKIHKEFLFISNRMPEIKLK
ncbi:MAG: hypothetical protein K2X94_03970 [Amoebophilaceae bacterium]|nr:hypothetical protein [Amoebophilaceae bacterium]